VVAVAGLEGGGSKWRVHRPAHHPLPGGGGSCRQYGWQQWRRQQWRRQQWQGSEGGGSKWRVHRPAHPPCLGEGAPAEGGSGNSGESLAQASEGSSTNVYCSSRCCQPGGAIAAPAAACCGLCSACLLTTPQHQHEREPATSANSILLKLLSCCCCLCMLLPCRTLTLPRRDRRHAPSPLPANTHPRCSCWGGGHHTPCHAMLPPHTPVQHRRQLFLSDHYCYCYSYCCADDVACLLTMQPNYAVLSHRCSCTAMSPKLFAFVRCPPAAAVLNLPASPLLLVLSPPCWCTRCMRAGLGWACCGLCSPCWLTTPQHQQERARY
jgi:hypothetical protein